MKVLCTLPMDPAGMALLEGHATVEVVADQKADTLYRAIGDADFLVVRSLLPPDIFDQPNRLRGVVRHGTGLDLIPVESATQHGIPVANVPGANAQAVAEYCLASMILWARRLDRIAGALRSEGWNPARAQTASATELAGKTVGIVGVGTIGARLAQICCAGFGMKVLGYQRNLNRLPENVTGAALDSLLAASDYVVLTCPLTAETRGLLDARRLRLMKAGAVLINAARGPVVDEDALAVALREGWIKGATLDVFGEQPLPPGHIYFGLDNVILTPHVGGLTAESTAEMSVGTARQILQLMRGERPEHLVNPEVWNRQARAA